MKILKSYIKDRWFTILIMLIFCSTIWISNYSTLRVRVITTLYDTLLFITDYLTFLFKVKYSTASFVTAKDNGKLTWNLQAMKMGVLVALSWCLVGIPFVFAAVYCFIKFDLISKLLAIAFIIVGFIALRIWAGKMYKQHQLRKNIVVDETDESINNTEEE